MLVAKKEGEILGFQVSRMPVSGHLAKISGKKYGKRSDDRVKGITQLFDSLSQHFRSSINISSEECPFYKGVVKKYFPIANYNQYLGKKGFISSQSQIKKDSFGPIPSTIHFAMMRANISRIIRKKWNTTKKIECLINHLNIYAWLHNTKKTYFLLNNKNTYVYL